MTKSNKELDVWTKITALLQSLDQETQLRTIRSILTYLELPVSFSENNKAINRNEVTAVSEPTHKGFFTEDRLMTPKEFLRQKSPSRDIERIACLAYYLTHYRETPHFKTIDLSTLNMEAAQPKFSNAALAVSNATRDGLLVIAVKGKKQISSAGELFVQALPDKDAAKETLSKTRIKRRSKKTSSKTIAKK